MTNLPIISPGSSCRSNCFLHLFQNKYIRIASAVALLVLGLILIIGGVAGIMPLVPLVVTGAVCLSVALFGVIGELIYRCKIKKIAYTDIDRIETTVKFDKTLFTKAKNWCSKEFAKRPPLTTDEHNRYFAENSTFEKDSTISKICFEEYSDAFALVCSQRENSELGTVIGCYPIFIQSLIRRDNSLTDLLSEDGGRFKASLEKAKDMPEKERILHLMGVNGTLSSSFSGISVGLLWMFKSYMLLRMGSGAQHDGRVDSEEFFNPNTDYFLARQILNDSIKAFLSVFPLRLLTRHAAESQLVGILYEACLIFDEGDEFLKIHQDYVPQGRDVVPNFFS